MLFSLSEGDIKGQNAGANGEKSSRVALNSDVIMAKVVLVVVSGSHQGLTGDV